MQNHSHSVVTLVLRADLQEFLKAVDNYLQQRFGPVNNYGFRVDTKDEVLSTFDNCGAVLLAMAQAFNDSGLRFDAVAGRNSAGILYDALLLMAQNTNGMADTPAEDILV